LINAYIPFSCQQAKAAGKIKLNIVSDKGMNTGSKGRYFCYF